MLAGHNVLVVEDDASLRAAVARWAGAQRARSVQAADSLARAATSLDPRPTLVVADVMLSDGDVLPFVRELASGWPRPVIVAMSGCASPEQAFGLASLGVSSYLPKPFGLAELAEAVARALERPPELEAPVRAHVGHVSLPEVQKRVRCAMLEEALARAGKNRSETARLLGVTRQAVQQAVREEARAEGPA
jgi:two-component system response regulator RegA